MTDLKDIRSQIKSVLRDGWSIKIIDKLSPMERMMGTHYVQLLHKNLGAEAGFYMTVSDKGLVHNLFMLPDGLKEREQEKAKQFSEAL